MVGKDARKRRFSTTATTASGKAAQNISGMTKPNANDAVARLDATAMAAVDDLCALGFFFGAAIPELRAGDILRLQYLNNVALDPDLLVLYTDEAKRLLQAILADRR